MKTNTLLILALFTNITLQAQILGGGTTFSNAVVVSQAYISSCTGLSNQVAFEPTVAMDPCAPAPSALCATGTTGSDVWFSFYAQSTTATIVAAPSSSLNVAIQAFSGSACPGIVQIGCIDAAGNNASETLPLTGLIPNTKYYFRIYGSSNGISNRTGTYTICGSIGLGSSILPLSFSSFTASEDNKNIYLKWETTGVYDNNIFIIEKSINGTNFEKLGSLNASGVNNFYAYTDAHPAIGNNYYRIKKQEINGSFTYSPVVKISVETRQNYSINVFPNPVVDKINLTVTSIKNTSAVIVVTDELGRILYRQQKQIAKGTNVSSIDKLAILSKGFYSISLYVNGAVYHDRFCVLQ
jgi:hypothetical protein